MLNSGKEIWKTVGVASGVAVMIAIAGMKGKEMYQKANTSGWSNVLTASQVGEARINFTTMARVAELLRNIAHQEGMSFSFRTIHPTEQWGSFDLLSDKYKILVTNPVYPNRYKIYVYLNSERGGTQSGAEILFTNLLDAMGKLP